MSKTDIPRGHLSTILMSTMLDGDKYGYEIIKGIEEKTNGALTIKQPSLYSSLKRLEEQKYISSYWRDSDIGGRRHYYSLTDIGKKQTLDLLQTPEMRNFFDTKPEIVNTDDKTVEHNKNEIQLNDEDSIVNNSNTNDDLSESIQYSDDSFIDNSDDIINEENDSPTFLQQENIFSIVKKDENDKNDLCDSNNNLSENDNDAEKDFEQFDLFSQEIESKTIDYSLTNDIEQQINAKEDIPTSTDNNINGYIEKHEDSEQKILETKQVEPQPINIKENKITKTAAEQINNFDISEELSVLLKNKKSFASSVKQSTIPHDTNTVFYSTKDFITNHSPLVNNDDENLQNATSLLHQSTNIIENDLNTEDISIVNNTDKTDIEEEMQEVHDDAVFITEKIDPEVLPKVRKIEPSILESLAVNAEKFSHNSTPISYNDIVEKTYNKNLDSNSLKEYKAEKDSDLNALKKYFDSKNISFKCYNESQNKSKINNYDRKTKILANVFSSIMACIVSLIVFITCKSYGLNYPYLFILLPVAVIIANIFISVITYKQKNYRHKVSIKNRISKIAICLLLIVLLYAINMLNGITLNSILSYSDTFILPASIIVSFPISSILYMLYNKFKNKN